MNTLCHIENGKASSNQKAFYIL